MIDPKYLYTEDGLFANFYFKVIRAWRRGEPIPEAWRIAFQAAEDGDKAGVQDMLLGINAHVQNDMPFVLASLGLRTGMAARASPTTTSPTERSTGAIRASSPRSASASIPRWTSRIHR